MQGLAAAAGQQSASRFKAKSRTTPASLIVSAAWRID
jgi:hypothetical protein